MPKKSKGRGRSGKGRGAESQVGHAKGTIFKTLGIFYGILE